MTNIRSAVFAATVTGLGLAGAGHAEGFYGTGMLGYSAQASDSKPYGNNIAADPDFPGAFDSGDGGVAALGVGYDFGNNFRLEGRLGYHQGDFNSTRYGTGARAGAEYVLDGKIESTTLTVEGFYDFPTNSTIKPYVKAGLGVARNSYSARLGGSGVAGFDAFDGTVDGYYDAYDDQTSTEFSWNVGVGASVLLNDKVTLFAEYQYVSFGDASTGQDAFTDGFRADAAAHEILIGVRARF